MSWSNAVKKNIFKIQKNSTCNGLLYSDVRPASWRKPEVIRGVVNLTRSFAFLFKFKPSSMMVLVPIRFAKKC